MIAHLVIPNFWADSWLHLFQFDLLEAGGGRFGFLPYLSALVKTASLKLLEFWVVQQNILSTWNLKNTDVLKSFCHLKKGVV